MAEQAANSKAMILAVMLTIMPQAIPQANLCYNENHI